MEDAKHFLTSWTVWFGILQIASAGVGYMAGFIAAPEAMTLFMTGLGTIGLRIKTTQPISA